MCLLLSDLVHGHDFEFRVDLVLPTSVDSLGLVYLQVRFEIKVLHSIGEGRFVNKLRIVKVSQN